MIQLTSRAPAVQPAPQPTCPWCGLVYTPADGGEHPWCVQEAQEAGEERGQCFPDDVPADYGSVQPWEPRLPAWIEDEQAHDAEQRQAAIAADAERVGAGLCPSGECPF